MNSNSEPGFNDIVSAARKTKYILSKFPYIKNKKFNYWLSSLKLELKDKISSKLYSYEIKFLRDFKAVPIK